MNDKTPSIRFKGFTDDWEQRKVKEICSISTGKSNTQDRVDEGIYPFYVRSPIVERSNRYLFDEEAVLTVGDGVGTGKVFQRGSEFPMRTHCRRYMMQYGMGYRFRHWKRIQLQIHYKLKFNIFQ